MNSIFNIPNQGYRLPIIYHTTLLNSNHTILFYIHHKQYQKFNKMSQIQQTSRTEYSNRSEQPKKYVTLESRLQHHKKSFKQFIYDRLKKFIPNDLINEFVTPDNMKIWEIAFTDTSYGYINYETYEKIGDAQVKAVFYDIMAKMIPYITKPTEYIVLGEYYLSEPAFIQMAKMEHFDQYIIADEVVLNNKYAVDKICEDLWESYHRALYIIGDKVGIEKRNLPLGNNCITNSMTLAFNNIEIDIDRAYGEYSSQYSVYSNIVKSFPTSIPIEGGKVGFYIYCLYADLFNVLKEMGKPTDNIERGGNILHQALSSKVETMQFASNVNNLVLLGYAVENNRKDAELEAKRAAVKTYRHKYLVTKEDATQYYELKKNPETGNDYARIREKYPIIKIGSREFANNNVIKTLYYIEDGYEKPITSIQTLKTVNINDVKKELYTKAVKVIYG